MPKTLIEKAWIAGAAFVALLMVVIGYFMFISPQRSQTSDVRSQVDAAHQQNQALRIRINQLAQQNQDIAKWVAAYKQADLAFPDQSGLSDFLRSLQAIGNATLANVNSLTVAAPKDVTASRVTTTTSKSTQSAGSAAAAAASGDQPTAARATGTTAGHVYSVAITATVSGTVAQLDQFLVQLQSVQPRAVLITPLTEGDAASSATTPTSGKSSQVTALNVTMLAFVKPSDATQAASLANAAGH